jgi:hypothetical protein
MMNGRHVKGILLATEIAAALAVAAVVWAQISPAASMDLRRQVERRFEVLPLRRGVALRPKSSVHGVRSIELAEDTIAIDGSPASGAELREKLGRDADLVLRLSYLDPDARQALFAPQPSVPERPNPPRPPVAPERVEAPEAERPDSPTPTVRRHRASDFTGRVRFGGSVTVEPEETVKDIVVIGGSADIQGQVQRDVVVIGGGVDLGPHADIGKDVTVIGGTVHRDPGARIGGSINEVGRGLDLAGLRWRRTRWGPRVPFAPFVLWGSPWSGLFSLVSSLTRLFVLWVLASLILVVSRESVERVGSRASAEPLKAGVVGMLAQLLFLPTLIATIVVLVILIITIPLLVLIPFALLALAVICLIGFTAVAHAVGRLVSARLGWSQPNPYLTAGVGITAVMSPVLLGRIVGMGSLFLPAAVTVPVTAALLMFGFVIEYLAWTVGFGAVALSRLAGPRA